MSRENVELVRQLYRAWNDQDWSLLIELVEPDHELRLTGLFPGLKPVYRGRAELQAALQSFLSVWPDFRVDVKRVEDAGDRVVGLVRLCGSGLGSGVPLSIEYGQVFHFDEEGCARTYGYRTWADALAAAGIDD